MARYAYDCPYCGPFESGISGDVIDCRCGRPAKRRFQVAFNRTSLRSEGRWDPVVGQYVESNRQFRSLLAEGIDRESEALGMDVKVATCDPRDTSALAELHGHSVEERKAVADKTKAAAQ